MRVIATRFSLVQNGQNRGGTARTRNRLHGSSESFLVVAKFAGKA
jgi:hypothetical protein